jgi:hypothetical protein
MKIAGESGANRKTRKRNKKPIGMFDENSVALNFEMDTKQTKLMKWRENNNSNYNNNDKKRNVLVVTWSKSRRWSFALVMKQTQCQESATHN